jgi:hypothetical protein
MTPPTVVYIISPSHSGSTLLDMLIASHSRVITAGEVKKLGRDRHLPVSERHCTCGVRDLHQCALWSKVDDYLKRAHDLGLDDLDLESDNAVVFAQHNRAFFDGVAAASGRRVIVDSSKSPRRLAGLLSLDGMDIRPVQIRRSPLGVVYSQIKKRRPWMRHTVLYGRHMAQADHAIGRRAAYRLRYETLASDPAATLTPLMQWLGLEFEARQLEWRSVDHHSVGGNDMRFGRDSAIRVDESWRKGMTVWQKAGVRLLAGPPALAAIGVAEACARSLRRTAKSLAARSAGG